MALSLSPLPSSPLPVTRKASMSQNISIQRGRIFNFTKTAIKTATNRKNNRFASIVVDAAEEQQKPTTTESETSQKIPKGEELSELGAEIKKAMMEREVKKDESFWGGVTEEIREIEWPAFNKVLGTTGVVLGVIVGSSVVLLTVNAVLAELSDRVFAGRGVQDFFS